MKRLDFGGLNRALIQRAEELLSDWFPQGKLRGREFCVGNLSGSQGDSLKVNIDTGKWADFAQDIRGHDLISLYAKINGFKNLQAAERLASRYNFNVNSSSARPMEKKPSSKPEKIEALPSFSVLPDRAVFGQHWKYYGRDGKLLFVISRKDILEDGKPKKVFTPWVWSNSKVICKQWPDPRPLYNLHKLSENRPVIVTEGEKACDAAEKICGKIYDCVTWAGGSNAFHKTDWSPLYDRRVVLWPDADDAGMKAMAGIEKLLAAHCTSIKVVNSVYGGKSEGWDAHDAYLEGMSIDAWKQWAKPIAEERSAKNKESEKRLTQPSIVDRIPEQIPPPTQVQVYMDSADAPQVPYVSDQLKSKWLKLNLHLNATATSPHLNVANAKKIINHKFGKKIWYDEFHNKYLTTLSSNRPREWTDHDSLQLAEYLQNEWGLTRISDELCYKAMQLYAMSNKKNEPRDWMARLKWDNQPRIQRFFDKALGSEQSEYAAAASRNWWISMVARIFSPGCKVDNMVILEGRQGSFKSTALSAVAGPWYAEITGDITSKDFYQALQGKMLVEIGELDSFNKHEVTTIKKVVSTAVDRYRPPYARQSQDFPRQCVFVGTTNEKHYLRDATGARRFWPVATTKIDLDYINRWREELFAEAVHLYKAGASWHKMPKSALLEQEDRRDWDEWENWISEWLFTKQVTETTVAEVAVQALDIDRERMNRQTQNRIARVLRVLGWESGKQKKIAGKTVRPWYPMTDDNGGQKEPGNPGARRHKLTRDIPNLAPSFTSSNTQH